MSDPAFLEYDESYDEFDDESTISSQSSAWIDRISIMKPTKRSISLEICLCSSAIIVVILNFVLNTNVWLKIPFSLLYILMSLLYLYFEIHKNALKALFFSFRGFVIISAIIIIIICDWIRCLFKNNHDITIYNLIIDDTSWFITILILMGADCIPRISKYIRFFGPLLIVANCIVNIIHYNNYADITLFKHKNGKITLNQIEIAATFQIILFGSTYIVSGVRDIKHKYFVILNKRIKKKLLLPIKDYGREYTEISIFGYKYINIKTKYMFISFVLFGIILMILFIVENNIKLTSHQHVSYTFYIFDILFTLLLLIMIIIMVYKHFETSMIRPLIGQFRCIMLLVSILISIYTAIQECYWGDSLIAIIHSAAFCLGIFIMIIRDGMLISYPLYFSICLCLGMLLINLYNLWSLTFDLAKNKYPAWFIIIKREPFYQVTVLCVLILFNMIRDCNETKHEKYFVLIRRKKKCKELFYPQNDNYSLEENKNNNHQIKMSIDSDIELVEMI